MFVLPMLFSAACGRSTAPPPPQASAPAEFPSTSVTRWSERTELFAEHPLLVVGRPARFAIHFTDLQTFKPLTAGRSTVRLTGSRSETFTTDAPSSPGIFGVTVTPTSAGKVSLRIDVSGPITDAHEIGQVEVYPTEAAARAAATGESDGEGIAFLKEQQWTLDFATAAVQKRPLRNALLVPGEVRPRTGGDAVVASPVAGRIVSLPANITIGAHVGAGAVLAELLPQSTQASDRPTLDMDLAQARAQVRLAEAERIRAERLTTAGAVPARRLEEAQIAESTARARLEAAEARLGQLDTARMGRGEGGKDARFVLRAPFAGVLTEILALSGVAVEQGAALFRVVALDKVDVVAQVPEADLPALATLADAQAVVPGSDQPVSLGTPLSRGRVLDPASRTLPVVFRLNAPPPQLAVGQRVTVQLSTGASAEAMAIPASALVDDGGRLVVFVQASGERFERRPVTVRTRDGVLVGVEGVKEGEHVVVRGAPLVRLASMSSQVPAHGHVH
jgi:RND family efflux transporter MFP subunit